MTTTITNYLQTSALAPPLGESEAQALAGELSQLSGLQVYATSLAAIEHALFFLGRRDEQKYLGVLAHESVLSDQFGGDASAVNIGDAALTLTICETSPANARALRSVFAFLNPQTLGLRKSAGCGDRLGLATPGHIRAIRHSTMVPILAQQSIRENVRTGRNPQEVMDDALWEIGRAHV